MFDIVSLKIYEYDLLLYMLALIRVISLMT